ncbi:uncharacterized protein EV420DRAFT_1486044 [Desarmillaria tabescens]|uniref:DUF3295 domain-containing protein n=1 Tax=Armillaria tabescens TaxID=1929756 RepID=A0AA39JCG4_ARMTA|nr:uncharacterized protein EV420DRAFT_1486044 [Desarmillaria tabescens]KAK0440215.1 hypothetical protein EV420DRAFT_1486044 [Desarmillaria tabescens]
MAEAKPSMLIEGDCVLPPPTTTKPQNRRRQQLPPPDVAKLQDAVLEAARQHDMFVKIPKDIYANVDRTRPSLLSQLMEGDCDPTCLPLNQCRAQSTTGLGSESRRNRKDAGLQLSRSAAAVPVCSEITVGSTRDLGVLKTKPVGPGQMGNSRYQPRGPPDDQEMDDNSDEDDGFMEEYLRGRFGKRGAEILGVKGRGSEPSIHSPTSSPPIPTPSAQDLSTLVEHTLLGLPCAIPAAAIPSTPRTTRWNMLRNEISDSIRQNLLWWRYADRKSLLGPRRRGGTSVSDGKPNAVINPVVKQVDQLQSDGADAVREVVRRGLEQMRLQRNKDWRTEYHPM